VSADIEIVVSLLPEMFGYFPTQANIGLEWATWGFLLDDVLFADQTSRDALLQGLQGIG
jgi:hypothetical protein